MTKTHKGCLHTEMTVKLKHKLFFKRITNYPLKKKNLLLNKGIPFFTFLLHLSNRFSWAFSNKVVDEASSANNSFVLSEWMG